MRGVVGGIQRPPQPLSNPKEAQTQVTEDANDLTAKSPNGPKRGRPKGSKNKFKDNETAQLLRAMQEKIEELEGKLESKGKTALLTDETVVAGPEAKDGQTPGTYINDPKLNVPIGKVRWSRAIIEKTYPPVTFTPMMNTTVRPHGITRGEWVLAAGTPITAPSIVRDIYENSMKSLDGARQWKGFDADQERAAFDATITTKTPHASPIKHVGVGWPESALIAGRDGKVDPNWEPEVGFPGGYGGKPLEGAKI